MSVRNMILPIAVAAFFPGAGLAQSAPPKETPASGEVPYGKVVIVDDGTCPKGQVKEITGGSREKAILRQVRCVKKPQ